MLFSVKRKLEPTQSLVLLPKAGSKWLQVIIPGVGLLEPEHLKALIEETAGKRGLKFSEAEVEEAMEKLYRRLYDGQRAR